MTLHVAAVPASHVLGLAAILFALGLAGALARRNLILLFLSVELMLNAANLNFVALGRARGSAEGEALALYVIAIAAAEVAVGLALLLALFRSPGREGTLDAAAHDRLRG